MRRGRRERRRGRGRGSPPWPTPPNRLLAVARAPGGGTGGTEKGLGFMERPRFLSMSERGGSVYQNIFSIFWGFDCFLAELFPSNPTLSPLIDSPRNAAADGAALDPPPPATDSADPPPPTG